MERIKEKDSAIFASSQTKGLPNLPPLPSTSSQSELYRVSKHVVYKYNFFIFFVFSFNPNSFFVVTFSKPDCEITEF